MITVDDRIAIPGVVDLIARIQGCPFCDGNRLQVRAHSIVDPPYIACLDCGATGPKGILVEPRQFAQFGMNVHERERMRQDSFRDAVLHASLKWNERQGPV